MEDNSGKKYVIELGDGFKLNGKTLYPVKGFNSLVFDEFGLSKLKSFDSEIERDKVYDAAFQAGVDYQYSKDSKSLNNMAMRVADEYEIGMRTGKQESDIRYAEGLADMYNAVCAILFPAGKTGLSDNEINQIFGTRMITDIFEMYDAEDIIRMIKEYQEEIRVGDEVKIIRDGIYGVVTNADYKDNIYLIFSDGSTCDGFKSDELEKTGNKFKIKEILNHIPRYDRGHHND